MPRYRIAWLDKFTCHTGLSQNFYGEQRIAALAARYANQARPDREFWVVLCLPMTPVQEAIR